MGEGTEGFLKGVGVWPNSELFSHYITYDFWQEGGGGGGVGVGVDF